MIVGTAILLFVSMDWVFGERILSQASPHFTENRYRKHHPIYHHGFVSDFRTRYARWGSEFYAFCTDENGFKSPCDGDGRTGTNFDIGIIGDSVTEAIGMPYEDSFAGQIAASMAPKRTANLGVSSYSPTIYQSKIKHLLSNGYAFGEIIVFIDISDIQDDAVIYRRQGDIVTGGRKPRGFSSMNFLKPVLDRIRRSLPLSYFALRKMEAFWLEIPTHASFTDHEVINRLEERSSWTFDPQSPDFGPSGVAGAIELTKANMDRLHQLLKQKGIKLSIAVYPWPAQLKHDIEQNLQVKVWEEFCEDRCWRFYNLMPAFFAAVQDQGFEKTYDQYYLPGDIHFNRNGNALMAEQFLKRRAQFEAETE